MREDNKETGDIRIEHCGLLYYSLAEFCRGEKKSQAEEDAQKPEKDAQKPEKDSRPIAGLINKRILNPTSGDSDLERWGVFQFSGSL